MNEKEQSNSVAHLSKAEFFKFKDNDFFHLSQTMTEFGKDLFYVKGILVVITPLIIAMLGMLVAILVRI